MRERARRRNRARASNTRQSDGSGVQAIGEDKRLELKVTLNEAMSERLRDIAKARGLDPNEVLERAVALYGYALDKAEPNGPFLQVKENGQDKKVAL